MNGIKYVKILYLVPSIKNLLQKQAYLSFKLNISESQLNISPVTKA